MDVFANHTDATGRNASCVGSCVANTTITKSALSQEAHQIFSPWVTQVVRLDAGSTFIELEWTVGPVPVGDGKGKEIISRIATDIASGDHFFTDSNGFETMLRTRNHRQTYSINLTEPITANYYPVNTAISIRDASAQLTVVPDRTQGGASLASGEIEMLLHRRLLAGDYPCTPDDASGALNCGGVSALNETQSAVYDTDGLVVSDSGAVSLCVAHTVWRCTARTQCRARAARAGCDTGAAAGGSRAGRAAMPQHREHCWPRICPRTWLW